MTDLFRKEKAFFWVLTTFASAGIFWCGWVSAEIVDSPGRKEVKDMIETQTPYLRDQKAIQEHLDRIEYNQAWQASETARNTEAINLLRIELAKKDN